MMFPSYFAFNLLNATLPLLVSLHDKAEREADQRAVFLNDPNLNLPVQETFDYIIVGGGTAGLALAGRLSEKFRVLVLEQGGKPPLVSSVPYLSNYLTEPREINFHYSSIPQKHAALENGGIVQTTAGKLLGGSSSHNEGFYSRGHPKDYDRWAELSDDPSWRYENFLKSFLKAEDYHGQFPNNGHHKQGGPWPVVSVKPAHRSDIWFDAGRELGMKFRDPNGPQGIGMSPMEMNRDSMNRRVSSYTAYIKPIEKTRKNLIIRPYSIVSEILFDGKKAAGVAYERHGIPSVVFASNEIILSAGVFVTPLILIKSGIGPLDQLQAAKIKPVSILPVGSNLFSHHSGIPLNISFPKDALIVKHDPAKLQFADFNRFVRQGRGPLANMGFAEGFLASKRAISEGEGNWPDLQIFMMSQDLAQDTLACSAHVTRPKSRGRLYFNVNGTTLEEELTPILDYNYFGAPSDLDVYVEGLEFCKKLVKTERLQNLGAKIIPIDSPACAHLGNVESREFLKCVIQQKPITSNLHAGTARMGRPSDPRSVVDSKLRVLGVEGLRVCDASIMSIMVNANPAGPVIAIAEKLAQELLSSSS